MCIIYLSGRKVNRKEYYWDYNMRYEKRMKNKGLKWDKTGKII